VNSLLKKSFRGLTVARRFEAALVLRGLRQVEEVAEKVVTLAKSALRR
jgi:hypothetical protein